MRYSIAVADKKYAGGTVWRAIGKTLSTRGLIPRLLDGVEIAVG